MTLTALLSEFSRLHELPPAARAEGGGYRLDFDDGGTVLEVAEASRGAVQLRSEVCRLDPESDEGRRVLSIALRGNLVRFSENPGVLSWEAGDRALFLALTLDPEKAEPRRFTEAVESFLNQVDGFRGGLEASRR